jgi:phosphoribosylformylglycinamidine synthase
MPRLGTVSPWASKATDIAHNCGLAVHRVERVTEYRLTAQEAACSAPPSRCRPTSAQAVPRCCTTA